MLIVDSPDSAIVKELEILPQLVIPGELPV